MGTWCPAQMKPPPHLNPGTTPLTRTLNKAGVDTVSGSCFTAAVASVSRPSSNALSGTDCTGKKANKSAAIKPQGFCSHSVPEVVTLWQSEGHHWSLNTVFHYTFYAFIVEQRDPNDMRVFHRYLTLCPHVMSKIQAYFCLY